MGGVFESFVMLFESDASKLDKGVKESTKTADGLEKTLLHTDQVANTLGASLLDVAKNAATALTGFLAFEAVKAMTTASAEATNELGDMATKARVSVETLHALRGELEANGKDAGALGGELEALAQRFRNPEKALGLIADRIKGMSQFRAKAFGEQFGLGADTVSLLMQGKKGLDDIIARNKELGTVTKEQVEVAQKFRTQQSMTNRVWDDLRRTVATAVLPAFTWALDAMQRFGMWIRDNRPFVIAFFGAVAAIITTMYLPALVRAVAATYALLAPYLAVAAVVAALGAIFALVVDDVMAFMNGQNSVIGELTKKWPWVGEAVKDVVQILRGFWDYLKLFAGFWSDTFTVGPRQAFKNLADDAGKMVDRLGERFPAIKRLSDFVSESFRQMSDKTGVTFDDIANAAQLMVDYIMMGLRFMIDLVTEGPTVAFRNLGQGINLMVQNVKGMFPQAGAVIDSVSQKMASAAGIVSAAWEAVMGVIGRVVEFAKGAVDTVSGVANKVASAIGFGDDGEQTAATVPQIPVETAAAIQAGTQQIQQAQNNPMAPMSSSAISNSTSQRSMNVTQSVGTVNVQTQASDPDAVAASIGQTLGDQMSKAVDQFDDGVAA